MARPAPRTGLLLHDGAGAAIAEEADLDRLLTARPWCWPHAVFGDALLAEAGPKRLRLIRDATCRLFGYHGLMDEARRLLARPYVRILDLI